MKITIETMENGLFFASVDDLCMDKLSVDEALGVAASALFGGKPLFVMPRDDFERWKMMRLKAQEQAK